MYSVHPAWLPPLLMLKNRRMPGLLRTEAGNLCDKNFSTIAQTPYAATVATRASALGFAHVLSFTIVLRNFY